jgi:predicted nucleic acid-binding protein
VEVIADSGGVYAIYDGGDEHHERVSSFLRTHRPTIFIPAPLLGELGYMLAEWLGEPAVVQFLKDLQDGAYTLIDLTRNDIQVALAVLTKHPRLKLGLCDASVVAVAQRLLINQILTVDRKHFRIVKNAKGKAFELLPWDVASSR